VKNARNPHVSALQLALPPPRNHELRRLGLVVRRRRPECATRGLMLYLQSWLGRGCHQRVDSSPVSCQPDCARRPVVWAQLLRPEERRDRQRPDRIIPAF
jgi:hypothetical protein